MTPARHRPTLRCYAALVLVNLMWAAQFSGAKLATAKLGPIAVAFLPIAISTVLLAPLLLFGRAAARPKNRAARKAVLEFGVLGGVGIIAAQLGLTWGVTYSLASNASVITLSIPVLMAVLAAWMLRERMTALRWLSFALAIAGVLIVSDVEWGSLDLFRGKYMFGNLLILVSCWGSAFYNVYSKKLFLRFTPVEVLVYSFLAADLFFAVLMTIFEPVSWTALGSLDLATWTSLLVIAVFSLTFSMLLFFWVIERIDVTQASVSTYLMPVFGVLLSAVTLGEKITLSLLLGGGLVFAGSFLVTIYEERSRSEAALAPVTSENAEA